MIDFRASVSVNPHECQIVTELPGGGGDNGGLGGSSVGVAPGVPVTPTRVGGGAVEVPLIGAVGEIVFDGVHVGLGVEVTGGT